MPSSTSGRTRSSSFSVRCRPMTRRESVEDRAEVTRLGEGLDEHGRLSDAAMTAPRTQSCRCSTTVGTRAPPRSPWWARRVCAVPPTAPSSTRCCSAASASTSRSSAAKRRVSSPTGPRLGVATRAAAARRVRLGRRQHAVHVRSGGERRRAVQRRCRRGPHHRAYGLSGNSVEGRCSQHAMAAIAVAVARLDGRP